MEGCSHENISGGVCLDCGMETGSISSGAYTESNLRYTEFHSYIDSGTVLPFEADLKGLSIPSEVKSLVIKLASSCPRETHRMGVRRQQLFSYIYIAYLQLGINFDPEKLRKEMKMTQREVNMSLRITSGTSSVDFPLPTNDLTDEPISAPVVVISPVVYLEEICKMNNITEYYTDILDVSKTLIKKNKILLEFNPKHMAIALVRYYLLEIGINTPKFAKINGISDSILKQHVSRISKTMEK